jgi:hypothetical protein
MTGSPQRISSQYKTINHKEIMTKKIILISLFVLFAGALIAGGIYRSSARSGYDISLGGENVLEITQNPEGATPHNGQAAGLEEGQQGERTGQGLGNDGAAQGRNAKPEGSSGQGEGGQGQGQQGQGQGQQGQGRGQNFNGQQLDGQELQNGQGSRGGGQGRSSQAESTDLQESVVIEGTISRAPAAGVDMIIETDSGQVLVGTGPGYLQEQGFDLAAGDAVQVSGFFEDDEFKAVTITRLSDGESVALRDEFGRPLWSGAGRRASSGEFQGGGSGQSNGRAAAQTGI